MLNTILALLMRLPVVSAKPPRYMKASTFKAALFMRIGLLVLEWILITRVFDVLGVRPSFIALCVCCI